MEAVSAKRRISTLVALAKTPSDASQTLSLPQSRSHLRCLTAAVVLGGVIFGYYGDRIGRKAMLIISLLPILDVIRAYLKIVMLASWAGVLVFTLFYYVTIFSISYEVTQLRLSQSTMLYCVMIAVVFMGIGILFFATISDRVGRRNLALFSTGFVGL